MLKPYDLPKINNVFWLSEDGYVKVVQLEPKREILFSDEAATLWCLIDKEEHTVEELTTQMAENDLNESQVMGMLNNFESLDLISTVNYLWKEDGKS